MVGGGVENNWQSDMVSVCTYLFVPLRVPCSHDHRSTFAELGVLFAWGSRSKPRNELVVHVECSSTFSSCRGHFGSLAGVSMIVEVDGRTVRVWTGFEGEGKDSLAGADGHLPK